MNRTERPAGVVGPVLECAAERRTDPDGVVIQPVGEVDQATMGKLLFQLSRAIGSAPLVQVDLSGVSFMDSWGLSSLLSAAAEAAERGVAFEVTRASRQVSHLFVITGVAVDFGWPTYAG